jgi:hypothetical protein
MFNTYSGYIKLHEFPEKTKKLICTLSSLIFEALPETITNKVNKSTFLMLPIQNPVKALLRLVSEKDGIFINITKNFLATPGFLKLAYRCILNKSGNCASNGFVKKSTIEGSNEQWFRVPRVSIIKN